MIGFHTYSSDVAFSLALTQAVYIYVFVRDKVRLNPLELVPASRIAETLEIPKPSVVKILGDLAQAGLFVSGTGIKGGVSLAPDSESRTLLDIFQAVEGRQSIFRLDHSFQIEGERPAAAKLAIQFLFADLDEKLKGLLAEISLGDFLPPQLISK